MHVGEGNKKVDTFPSQELPCSGVNTGIISASLRRVAPRGSTVNDVSFQTVKLKTERFANDSSGKGTAKTNFKKILANHCR
jgi:hypothetical protein